MFDRRDKNHDGKLTREEFLDGQEVSLFVLSDGENVVPLSPAQDYKRALDGDEEPAQQASDHLPPAQGPGPQGCPH